MGNILDAMDFEFLKLRNITAVLSVTDDIDIDYTGTCVTDHMMIPAHDIDSYNLEKHFDKTFDWIDENLSNNV